VLSNLARHDVDGRGSNAVLLLYGNDIVALRRGSWNFLGVGAALACSASIVGSRMVVDFMLEIDAGITRGRSRIKITDSRRGRRYRNGTTRDLQPNNSYIAP